MTAAFVPPRNRDAWAVIRGFYYQIGLTIRRWLDLRPGDVLELECGEDIDHVSAAVGDATAVNERLLEQVKHRQRPLTLRSPAVLQALACAVEHREANREVDLLFRFTTNATASVERSSPFPDATPAIAVWEDVRTGKVTAADAEEAATAIRDILLSAPPPDGLPSAVWDAFVAFLGNADAPEMLELIGVFTWSMGTGDDAAIGQEIVQQLQLRGCASAEQPAQDIYARLVLYVFKLLSQSGPKRLTVADLGTQLAMPALSEQDSVLLGNLRELIGALEAKVADLGERVGRIESVIPTQLLQLAQDHVRYSQLLKPPATARCRRGLCIAGGLRNCRYERARTGRGRGQPRSRHPDRHSRDGFQLPSTDGPDWASLRHATELSLFGHRSGATASGRWPTSALGKRICRACDTATTTAAHTRPAVDGAGSPGRGYRKGRLAEVDCSGACIRRSVRGRDGRHHRLDDS